MCGSSSGSASASCTSNEGSPGAGNGSSLSAKFSGEVERGEKSISVDSLYKVSMTLQVPLPYLVDVRPGKRVTVPSQEAERIFALVTDRRRPPAEIRQVYGTLRRVLSKR